MRKRGWTWTAESRKRLSLAKQGAKNGMWGGGKTPEQRAQYAREWRKRNESRVRDQEYQKRFGITLEEYERMLAAQSGVCAICKEPCKRGRLGVDHDHATGRVRGLLCRSCNIILGLLEDDPEWLKSAEVYLASSLRGTEKDALRSFRFGVGSQTSFRE